MIPKETIGSGAPSKCPDCGCEVEYQVMVSGAGMYVGTMCDCGPYSRETGYTQSREEADKWLSQLMKYGYCEGSR